ncbi:hypothetical protein D7B24_009433 [Verticillium nonalfalfae]|uniref:Mitochondrial inner membrane protease subunit n=2 Tax=Verticillium TaxID=1036719 RepID=C9SRM0_VERA1|nr:conserved hypothetical protein [Verticillium alfalfae VaMs.102]XP_028492899.1 uncharacterized protein D7B24_009433 [Verticillium nonalfalfae]EEY21435.1 conserved hypothetical protein [Verticillium alfalfae VaMs.102]RNJ54741.1 hypothetical protein D7B24_009433 [Verticillium nonalfalfae]
MAPGPFARFAARQPGRNSLLLFLGTFKALAAAHLLIDYGYRTGPAQGASMLPTFSIFGDHFLISHHHRRGRGIRVGDLVEYSIPIFRNSRGIKRVIGMPGDYVLMHTPGAPVAEGAEPYMMQVPEGHCWIVGDNLPSSRDSRTFGPLPLASIHGKVIAKVLPLKEAEWIENPLDESH